MNLQMRSNRVGVLHLQHGDELRCYCVTVHASETLVETYKSHNHVNLVKSADIGQVLLVHQLEMDVGSDVLETGVKSLMDLELNGQLPPTLPRGITPPMDQGCASPL